MKHFAAFISGCCEKCEIHHFDRTGVAKTVEYASRMVADQEKLTSRFARIRELVQEAEYWATRDGASLVTAQHVETAVEERYFRHNLPEEKSGPVEKYSAKGARLHVELSPFNHKKK